jgi:hypothetical protein
VPFNDTGYGKASITLGGQHLFYPRPLKGDRRLDVTQQAAEQSKDVPKAKTKTKVKL